jgi:signal peptidase II
MPLQLRQGLLIALAAVIIDQASKWWMLGILPNPGKSIEVTPFFNLVHVWNWGISFGLFSDHQQFGRWGLTIVALIIVVVLFFWLRRAENKFIATGLGLIIGGALGTVIDRLVHSAVFDFLDFHVSGYHWPAFNAADSFITVGAVLLIFDSLFSRSPSENRMPENKGETHEDQ